MRRREVIKLAGLAAGSVSLGWLVACADSEDAGGNLDDRLGNLLGIGDVAGACVAALAERNHVDAETLADQLRRQWSNRPSADRDIAGAIQSDYLAGRTLTVDEWQLSHTECELIALARLSGQISGEAIAVAEEFSDFVEVDNWGPQSTCEGMPFNQQSDGHSGIWVSISEGLTPATVLLFDGKVQQSHIHEKALTSGLRGDYMDEVLSAPGDYPVELLDRSSGRRQRIGTFSVNPVGQRALLGDGSRSSSFSAVSNWGPQQARSGEAFNEQPDGSSAFWVQTDCPAPGAILRLEGQDLVTRVQGDIGLVSALLPADRVLSPGKHVLELHDPASGESLRVGVLEIR